MTDTDALAPDYSCHVLPGDAFQVISGANLGDPLKALDELCPGDVYRLAPSAQARQLAIADSASRGGRVLSQQPDGQTIARGSEIGRPGGPLHLEARLTFLGRDGAKVEMLLIALSGPRDRTDIVAMPLDPVEPGHGHTLIGIDESPRAVRLTDITALAFGQGTQITLADGRQASVESLSPGDRLLTRDHGAQPLRAVLPRTVRAVGPYAPVVIPAGTLGNAGDLILGQQQRLFIYQRGNDRLTETAEMLVKAHYLVDDDRIFLRPGGYGDFYALVLDHHEVIYAECIPVESLEISATTLPALPEDFAREVGTSLPDLKHRPHFGTEASRDAARAARERLLKGRSGRD